MRIKEIMALLDKLLPEELIVYLLTALAGLVTIVSLLTGTYEEAIAVIFFLLLIVSYSLLTWNYEPQKQVQKHLINVINVILVIGLFNLLSPAGKVALTILGISTFVIIGLILWQNPDWFDKKQKLS
jgi:uncharacterized membrane protein